VLAAKPSARTFIEPLLPPLPCRPAVVIRGSLGNGLDRPHHLNDDWPVLQGVVLQRSCPITYRIGVPASS